MVRGLGQQSPPQFFYGWMVVAGLSVVGGLSMSMGFGNFSLFIKPMTEDLGIGQSAFGWSHTLRMLCVALSAPVIGWMVDRFGARGPLAVASLLLGLGIVAMAFINAGWQMLVLFTSMGLLGFRGSQSLYFSVPVAKWFIRRRGRAVALTFIGVPAGIAISVPLTQLLIDLIDWRATWLLLGAANAVLMAAISLLLVRSKPEDMGLLPDGVSSVGEAEHAYQSGEGSREPRAEQAVHEYSWTRAEAVRTAAFWRLAFAFALFMFAAGSIGLFRVPFYTDRGLDPQIVAFGLSSHAVTEGVVAGLLFFVVDRVRPQYVGAGGCVCLVAAIFLVMATTQVWQMFAAEFFYGAGLSMLMLTQGLIWPRYFGRVHLGAIRGWAMPVSLGFGAAGGSVTGMVFDATGSYFGVWWFAAAGLLAGTLLILLTPRPWPQTVAPTASEDTAEVG